MHITLLFLTGCTVQQLWDGLADKLPLEGVNALTPQWKLVLWRYMVQEGSTVDIYYVLPR